MQATTGRFGLIKRGLKHRLFFKRTGFNGAVDAEQILVDDPPGADVHVANFAVAHLSIGQPDVFAVGAQGGFGVSAKQPIHEGCVGCGDGVARIVVADAPSVQDDQGAFSGRVGHEVRGIFVVMRHPPRLLVSMVNSPPCMRMIWWAK